MDGRIDLTVNRDFSRFKKQPRINWNIEKILRTDFKFPWKIESRYSIVFNSFKNSNSNIFTGSVTNIKDRKQFIYEINSCCECCGKKFSVMPWKRAEQGHYGICNICDSKIDKNKFWPGFIKKIRWSGKK